MPLVAGLDFGGGAVKACLADIDTGEVIAVAQQRTDTLHPAPGRAEFEPDRWWAAAAEAMHEALDSVSGAAEAVAAVTATSLRQGYVRLDGAREIGRGVVNSDRRGDSQIERLRELVGSEQLYRTTGHWPAPQLTLPKLMEDQASDPQGMARTETLLFVHDWALWRLSGVRASEPTMASAGQMLDIRTRTWASDLIARVGLDAAMLPSLHDAGSSIGELRDGSLGLPPGLPVVVGGGDTQMASLGVGGLAPGIVTVVAGTTTPLQATASSVPDDPERHPWVSAHLLPGRWAVEVNAGYAGMSFDWLARLTGHDVADLADEACTSAPGADGIAAVVAAREWSEAAWSHGVPAAVVGIDPRHSRADLARAFMEAHAYAIRGNLDDLDRILGTPATAICLTGGAARSDPFCQLVADVTGRPIHQADEAYPAGRGFAWLAGRATMAREAPPGMAGRTIEPREHAAYAEGYHRFVAAGDAIGRDLRGWAT